MITGSNGLIGSEATRFFCNKGFMVIGIDNNFRMRFFGPDGDTTLVKNELENDYPLNYRHSNLDVRDLDALKKVFNRYKSDIRIVIHAAAQPSHDWAATNPLLDFEINCLSTFNLLECTRLFSPEAVFVYMSTNKVYGDKINGFDFIENGRRFVPKNQDIAENGIDEMFSVDQSLHSIFGVNKLSSDLMTQEYGRYFGLKTTCLRGGCLTGPSHRGAELHGFLSYLVKCAVQSRHYTVYGFKGAQVRDNLHSRDVASGIWEIYLNPGFGDVFNLGGGIFSNISIMEAIDHLRNLGFPLTHSFSDIPRVGDHKWWISDVRKFINRYPNWSVSKNSFQIIEETIDSIQN